MQIVIDIDDMAYKFVQDTSFVEDESTMFEQTNADRKKTLLLFDILDAIQNGTPLPKGHGRLIDADDLIQELSVVSSRPVKSQLYILREAQTIIEADKAESEDKE
jgi:hypothetical protein